jgi:hypothetical protein
MYKRFCERAEKFSAEVRKVLCRSCQSSLQKLSKFSAEVSNVLWSRWKPTPAKQAILTAVGLKLHWCFGLSFAAPSRLYIPSHPRFVNPTPKISFIKVPFCNLKLSFFDLNDRRHYAVLGKSSIFVQTIIVLWKS